MGILRTPYNDDAYGSPASYGAASFVDAMLKAYKGVSDVRLSRERLEEERRQADMMQKFRDAQQAQLEFQTRQAQADVAQRDAMRAAAKELFGKTRTVGAGFENQVLPPDVYSLPQRDMTQNPPGSEVGPSVASAVPQLPLPTRTEQTQALPSPEQVAAFRAQFMPEKSLEDMALIEQMKATQTGTRKTQGDIDLQPSEKALREAQTMQITAGLGLVPYQKAKLDMEALHLYASAMRDFASAQAPKLENMTAPMKEFLGPIFPDFFNNKEAHDKAIAWLGTDQGRNSWKEWYNWYRTTNTAVAGAYGPAVVPTRGAMPEVPTPGTASSSPSKSAGVVATPVVTPTGEGLGNKLPKEAVDDLKTFDPLFKTIDRVEKNWKASYTGIEGAARLAAAKVRNDPEFVKFKNDVTSLIREVYAMSGKQIGTNFELPMFKSIEPQILNPDQNFLANLAAMKQRLMDIKSSTEDAYLRFGYGMLPKERMAEIWGGKPIAKETKSTTPTLTPTHEYIPGKGIVSIGGK